MSTRNKVIRGQSEPRHVERPYRIAGIARLTMPDFNGTTALTYTGPSTCRRRRGFRAGY